MEQRFINFVADETMIDITNLESVTVRRKKVLITIADNDYETEYFLKKYSYKTVIDAILKRTRENPGVILEVRG